LRPRSGGPEMGSNEFAFSSCTSAVRAAIRAALRVLALKAFPLRWQRWDRGEQNRRLASFQPSYKKIRCR